MGISLPESSVLGTVFIDVLDIVLMQLNCKL